MLNECVFPPIFFFYVLHGVKMVSAYHVAFGVQVWRSTSLIFRTSAECAHATNATSGWTHVRSEPILAPSAERVAPRAKRTHAHSKNCSQPEVNLHAISFYYCERVSSGCGATKIILRQLQASVALLQRGIIFGGQLPCCFVAILEVRVVPTKARQS